MDSKQFLKVLAKLIREEVRQAVREELRTALVESKVTQPRTTQKPGLLAQALVSKPRPVAAPPAPRRFQIPGAVGDILNETAMSMMAHHTAPEIEEEWSTAEGGSFTQEQAPAMAAPNYNHPSGDPTMAFVKDYRAVVKSAEAIHNSKY